MDWADLRATAFDFETTGTLPEFALQPWRIHQRESDGLTRFSLTSLAVYPDYQQSRPGFIPPRKSVGSSSKRRARTSATLSDGTSSSTFNACLPSVSKLR